MPKSKKTTRRTPAEVPTPPPAAAPVPFLTLQEAAALLRISERTTTKLLREGTLEGVRVGPFWRIRPAALERFGGEGR